MAEYKVINQAGEAIHPLETIHPGEILGNELEAREIKQKIVASAVGLRPSHLNEFIKGRRNFSHNSHYLQGEFSVLMLASGCECRRIAREYFLHIARPEESEVQKLRIY